MSEAISNQDEGSAKRSRLRVAYLAPVRTNAMGGVSRFDTELHRAMNELVELTVIPVLPDESSPWRKIPIVGSGLAKILTARQARRQVRKMEERDELDLVFHSFHWPPRVSRDAATIGFIHDLRMIGGHDRQPLRILNLKGRLVKKAIDSWDVVCVPSQHVADDVEFLLPWVAPEVVGEGVDHLPVVPNRERSRIFITTGSVNHKRPELAKELALHVHDQLRIPVTILGVAPGNWVGPRDIQVLYRASDKEIATALSESLVCLATSAYEGFGLSAGEAMSAGCPVVFDLNSHVGALVGDAGIGVDATLEAFFNGLKTVMEELASLGTRASDISGKYRWTETATKILGVDFEGIPKCSIIEDNALRVESQTDSVSGGRPFWSVVIPTYNRSKELSGAINSVLNQSDEDFELIVIDDASTDNTEEIVANICDGRIGYLKQEKNRGASAARNTGIHRASGTFVAFLDSDDAWHLNKLELLRKEIERRERLGLGTEVVIHSSEIVDDSGTKDEILDSKEDEGLTKRLLSGEFIQTSAVTVRREVAIRAMFDTSLPTYEDWDFLMRIDQIIEFDKLAVVTDVLSTHDAKTREGRLSQDDRVRRAGSSMMRNYLIRWSRSERSSFRILRQLSTEIEIRTFRNLCRETIRSLKGIEDKTIVHLKAAVLCLMPKTALRAHRVISIYRPTIRSRRGLLFWRSSASGQGT